jgi:hypothetical protein
MSLLRDILVFMFALQLALQVTNHIEIIPGLHLNTGQLSPFTAWYDPMNDLITTLNYTQQSLNPSIPTSNNGTGSCNVTCSNAWVHKNNLRWDCVWATDFFYPAGRCELSSGDACDSSPVFVTYILSFLNIFAFSWVINLNEYFSILNVSTGLPTGQIMNVVGFVLVLLLAAINLIVEIFLIILMTVINITIGSIPFYINLFSLIDPVLGNILGTCLGGMQILVISWAILEAVPQIQLKGKE